MDSTVLDSQQNSDVAVFQVGARRYLPYLALLFPFLLILPGLFSFPYPIHGESDLAVTHYPNAIYLLDALKRYGEVPLWSPTILSGYPFFADPLAGLWYLPGWLALFFPLPFGFNLLVALHLAWGGLGMTWLLRREGLERIPALTGGVAFACLPKLYAHFGAGHLSLLYAIPWIPWLLAASLNSLGAPQSQQQFGNTWRVAFAGVWRLLLPGIILALVFLADARAAAYAGVLWLAYVFSHSHIRAWPRVLARLVIQCTFALVIAAPQALPLLEYTRLSTRASMLPSEVLVYSLPPGRLIWLLFPDFGGFHEYVLYPGAVVLVLAISAIASRSARSGRFFWLGTFLISLLFALGEHLPGMERLVGMAGLDLLRVPSRALFVSGMALAALSAYGLEGLLEGQDRQDRRLVRALVAFSTLALALVIGLWLALGVVPPNLWWGAAAILISSLLVGLLGRGSYRRNLILLGLLILAAADWSLVGRLAYTTRPVDQVLSEGADAAQFLAEQSGRFRTYSPSYSIPQQTGVHYGIEQADGVDPLQLAAYVKFMDQATGVLRAGYSVTIPPYATGSPRTDNREYLPDPDLLGMLGVRYVLSEFDLNEDHLALVKSFRATRLYENSLARPVAWLQPESSPLGEDIRPVSKENWEPNRIVIETTGPGLLVLSEIVYPGWKAWVDGEQVEVEAANDLLRAVRVGEGEHTIEFRFCPDSFYWGLVILIFGSLLFPSGLQLVFKSNRGFLHLT